jgi:hypothetical protein
MFTPISGWDFASCALPKLVISEIFRINKKTNEIPRTDNFITEIKI